MNAWHDEQVQYDERLPAVWAALERSAAEGRRESEAPQRAGLDDSGRLADAVRNAAYLLAE